MEWLPLNDAVEMFELVDSEKRQVAVAYKRSEYAWRGGTYGYITANIIANEDIFTTMEEAKEAALVAYVTARIGA